mmetsp:Transcript_7696/g.11583  ORF Transcript_7696/g.11583 Transcript_7696/m.11583 type:complete len:659 (+) Transcript_7696:58-2034(+)|eukprot:CAMPEP_0171451672 /NCGR_PEP_ID=MMETSP0945-20130129/83_1 /TAXON_ID=109269 /ORGANISM="Vaucheria litorea, Strain CCMP2940" /LENGTH=658 /DNA_ID=CAMNT_0011976179 /DNA_START=50 /DNA_END=2026 /DNA_ORIENTATION=-
MTDSIEALNLIMSSRIGELYHSKQVEDPLILRKKAADFRKGYKNWRQKKPKGARGETNYLLQREKQEASALAHEDENIMIDAKAEVHSILMLHKESLNQSFVESKTDTVKRQGSLSRTNSFSGMEELPIHDKETENWLKFYVNPYSGMAESSTTEPVQLTQESLKIIPNNVVKPKYLRHMDKEYVDRYICHIGVGGFHRSHQCVYTDDLLNLQTISNSKSPKWGFCGIGLMDWDKKMYDTLKSQDCLFTVLSRGHQKHEARIIGSVVDFLFAPENHQAVIDKMTDEKTGIVSLTITEKGYCQNNKGDLDLNNTFVKFDIENNLKKPKTAIGLIVAALRQRMNLNMPSFTVLSCDNLPENGDKAKHCVLQMAEYIDPSLKFWILENTCFPNTMVDRITPVTDQEHKDILARDHLILDGWPVIAEDFSQWIIENSFSDGCPEWDKVGALIVNDVQPYEFMKLRLLNGGHSALSYIGLLSGYHYVDDAMSDPLVSLYISSFFNEMLPTLLPVPGVNTHAYCSKLIERFGNPYIKDRLTRLAEDGSKKMQNTMKDAIVYLYKRNMSTSMLALANASWITSILWINEDGERLKVRDPLNSKLENLAQKIKNEENPDPKEFLVEVHGSELGNCTGFIEQVASYLKSMAKIGFKETIQEIVNGPM